MHRGVLLQRIGQRMPNSASVASVQMAVEQAVQRGDDAIDYLWICRFERSVALAAYTNTAAAVLRTAGSQCCQGRLFPKGTSTFLSF